jgi:hypothetical protein
MLASPLEDDESPRMVILIRRDKEIAAIDADDAEDAARQAAILILQQKDGLMVGDQIVVSRI